MKRHLSIRILLLLVCSLLSVSLIAQPRNPMRATDDAFFQTDEARRIGDQMLLYQRVTGGWPKNIDMARDLSPEERARIARDKQRDDDSTIDNGATTMQMKYLARLYKQTGEQRYKEGFRRGVEYLLSGQYEDGGWPQFWPNNRGYQVHITYNDDAMVNTLTLFRDLIEGRDIYGGDLIDDELRERLRTSFDKGIDCILNTQIRVKGKPTIWCQQHDHETFEPAAARAYELPSYGPSESAGILRLLMELPNPDKRVKAAVHGGMKWLDTYKLTGLRYVRARQGRNDTDADTHLEKDPTASPLWGRFYDLVNVEPYVCDRDGLPRKHLDQIGPERRNGYGWYVTRPAELYPLYDAWADKYDKRHKVKISLDTKGANETGLIDMDRKPVINPKNFDIVVRPGESIQKAIEQAPDEGTEPFKILIMNGIYHQKVIIDKPNIVLVGEDRDSTRLILAETGNTITVPEYKGKKVHMGVIVLTEEADNCVISGMTVYNNYGTTVEETTVHQMAIYGRANHTIIVNCNVWADGNDALSLWAPEGEGMYYHADLDLRCPGVDFMCPRGWCFATRCKFYGDGRAILWHDGRGNRLKKFVVKDSWFDAKSPTLLGRYHHDHQIYLINCHLSEQILDANIQYAYSDKVLDPCPWGNRVYYYHCIREGGQGHWLDDNLQQAVGSPRNYEMTAQWTFNYEWDPEQCLRDLWYLLAY